MVAEESLVALPPSSKTTSSPSSSSSSYSYSYYSPTLTLSEEEESLLLSSFTTGDWSLYVHILEVSNLHAENVDGTSDPVVMVDFMGHSWSTRVARGARCAVFDESHRFEVKGMGSQDLSVEGIIMVKVLDAGLTGNSFMGSLVGQFVMDALWLYSRKDREVVRTWVALYDEAKSRDKGCQVGRVGRPKRAIIIINKS